MAKVKQVFPSSEIPHLWFHGLGNGQTYAKNAQGNLYFEGPSIFSYGRHYEIARKVETPRGTAVLFTIEGSTHTTEGQKHAVRLSIPNATSVFRIPALTGNFVSASMHQRSLDSYGKRIESALLKAARARSSWAKESNHEDAQTLTKERNAYCVFFGLRNKPLADVPALDSEAMEGIKAKESKRIKAESQKAKVAKAQRLARASQAVEAWREGNGDSWNLPFDAPTMLRINGDEIETSKGARIPVSHAQRALILVRAVISRNEAWATNGHTCHVGNYKIDRIEANGTIKAGCHVIEMTEWERIASRVDAFVSSPSLTSLDSSTNAL